MTQISSPFSAGYRFNSIDDYVNSLKPSTEFSKEEYQAATKILAVYRRYKREQSGKATDLSRQIDKLIINGDRSGLKRLANQVVLYNRVTCINPAGSSLMWLFLDRESSLFAIGEMLIFAQQEAVEINEKFNKAHPVPKKQISAADFTPPEDPERIFSISHGGSLGLIRKFLTGRSKGYDLVDNRAGKGFWVAPIDHKRRDRMYAERHAEACFDYPGYFRAEIQAKYLECNPNAYEAWLRADNVKHLKKVEVGEFTDSALSPSCVPLDQNKFPEDLTTKCYESILRVYIKCKGPYKPILDQEVFNHLEIEYLDPSKVKSINVTHVIEAKESVFSTVVKWVESIWTRCLGYLGMS